MKKQTILVTGATGYIGRRLVDQLLADGKYDLRLLVRNKAKVQLNIFDQVDIYEGDTFDKEKLVAAFQGVEVAYYLIHSMGSDKDYRQLDRISAENFRDACIEAGVRRIIYLGGLGTKKDASKHLLSRIETGEILSARPDKIHTIWIRAGVIIGSGSASFEILRHLTQKLPVMITPLWVRTRTQPIGIDDVLAYLVSSISLSVSENLIVDIGSENMSFQQMMKEASKVMGLRRFLVPVPFLSPKFSSYWLILITPVPYRIASALVEGLKSETVLQNSNARDYYQHITPRPFRESVRAAIDELGQHHVVSRWCDSSGRHACDIKDFDDPSDSIYRDVRIVDYPNEVRQEDIFQAACSIGGQAGWFKYDFLWRLRGLFDKLVGGYGLSRGRRLEEELRVGDALDFWKVADIKHGKRLLLYAQMKLPGQGWLEFDVQPQQLVQTAHFIPKGVWGRLYWYAVLPLHHFVLSDLARAIVNAAIIKQQKERDEK